MAIYMWREGRAPGANTIAYYPLNSTTTVNDMKGIGTAYNLTNSGITFGTYNGVDCAYLDGTYAYRSDSLFTGNQTFTVSFWAKTLSFNSYNRCYWFVGKGTGAECFGMFVSDNGTGHKLNVGGWDNDRATTYVMDTNWHNVVFTYYNGTGVVSVDGNSVYTGTWSPNISNYRTVLGGNPNFADTIQAYMSELIFENKARTAQEISDYFNLTKGLYGIN